jgi:hypothetical protein
LLIILKAKAWKLRKFMWLKIGLLGTGTTLFGK